MMLFKLFFLFSPSREVLENCSGYKSFTMAFQDGNAKVHSPFTSIGLLVAAITNEVKYLSMSRSIILTYHCSYLCK